jgi:hypothetical protein
MDFRYLVETKNEFNNFVNGILVPHIYNGLTGMLDYSINMHNLIEEKKKKDKSINNPGIISIYKMCLSDISTLNNHEIENEYKRIKEKSGCSDWFDNLIRACFKSYILFLTWDPETNNSKYSDNEIYNQISIKDYIHKCYIETCNYFNDNPEIFLKKNMKKEIFDIIKFSIELAMKKTLPYNDIIQEYLRIEFKYSNSKSMLEKNINDKNTNEIQNIKNLVNKIIEQNKYGVKPVIENLINDNSDYQDIENDEVIKKIELENFINEQQKYKINDLPNILIEEQNINLPNVNLPNIDLEEYNNKSINLDNASSKNNETSTTLMTRSEVKRKEIDEFLVNSESNDDESSNLTETFNSENNLSETSDSESILSKKSINKLQSPIPVKKKSIDRLMEDKFSQKSNFKKKIEIISNKKNNLSDRVDLSEKIDNMEPYFNNFVK